MTAISPTDIAFEGFRLTRERPLLLVGLAVFNFVVSFAIVLFAAEAFTQLETLTAAEPADFVEGFAKLPPHTYIALLAAVLVQVIPVAAVYRACLRPGDRSLGFLWLGMDEVRLVALLIIKYLLLVMAVFLFGLAAGVVALVATTVGGTTVGSFIALASTPFGLGILVFAAVRLSLAAPMTFTRHKLTVFESWRVTKGQFWRLFVTYALAGISGIVVYVLATVIFAGVAAVAFGGDLARLGEALNGENRSVGDYLNPLMLASSALASLLSGILTAAGFAPGAAALKVLGTPEPETAEA